MTRRLNRVAPLVMLILVAGLTIGCEANGDGSADEQLEIVRVERGPLTVSITAVGSVRPRAEVALSFGAGGEVSDVLVQAGDRVRARSRSPTTCGKARSLSPVGA